MLSRNTTQLPKNIFLMYYQEHTTSYLNATYQLSTASTALGATATVTTAKENVPMLHNSLQSFNGQKAHGK